MDDARANDSGLYRPLSWAAAFGLTAGALMLWRSFYCPEWINLGLVCDRAFRITRGQTPYLDFFCPTTPLMYYSLALWFRLFGVSSLTSQVYAAAQCGLVVAITVYVCYVGLGFSKTRTAFMGALQSIWAPTMMLGSITYDGDASFYTLLTGLFLFAADRRPERKHLFAFLSGAAAGLAFWSKQDMGAGAVAGAGAAVFLLFVLPPQKGRPLLLPFAAGLGAVFGVAAVFFLLKGACRDMLYWVFQRAVMVKWGAEKGPGGLSKFISPFTTTIDKSTKYVALLYAVACASGWIKTLTGRGQDDPALGAVCLVFLGAFYAAALTHNGQGYTAGMSHFGIALALLWRQVERAGKDFGRPRLISFACFAFCGAIGLRGWHYLDNLPHYHGPWHTLTAERLRGMHVPSREGPAVDRLLSFIRERIPPQDSFLSFDLNMVPYFVNDRLCPLPFTNHNPSEASRELDEEILIKAASKPEIRWLLSIGTPGSLGDRFYLRQMPGLLDYLLKNFEVKETLGGPPDRQLTVWTRR